MYSSVCVCTCLSKCVCRLTYVCANVCVCENCMNPLCVFLHACESEHRMSVLHACVPAFMFTCIYCISQSVCVFVCYECLCACGSIWSASWALWPRSNGRKHQFHYPVSSSSPSPPLSLYNFSSCLALPPSSSPPSLLPSSVPHSLRRCDYVSSSEHQWSKGFSVCVWMCVSVCVWWLVGDLSSPALRIVWRNSRTTSPDECLHSQLQPLH